MRLIERYNVDSLRCLTGVTVTAHRFASSGRRIREPTPVHHVKTACTLTGCWSAGRHQRIHLTQRWSDIVSRRHADRALVRGARPALLRHDEGAGFRGWMDRLARSRARWFARIGPSGGGARGASGLGTRLETPLGRHGRGGVCYNQTRNESTVKSSGLSCTLRVPPHPSPAVTLVHS